MVTTLYGCLHARSNHSCTFWDHWFFKLNASSFYTHKSTLKVIEICLYLTVPHSPIQSLTVPSVPYCPLQSLTVPYSPLQSLTVPYSPIQSLTVPTPLQSLTVPYSPLQSLTVPYSPLQSLTVPYSPLQSLTVPHSKVLLCSTFSFQITLKFFSRIWSVFTPFWRPPPIPIIVTQRVLSI
jgi:hypothetical protein